MPEPQPEPAPQPRRAPRPKRAASTTGTTAHAQALTNAAVVFHDVTFTYDATRPNPQTNADVAPVLANVSLSIDEGTFCLVAGRTGAGKSTFLRLINGLVPRFSGGTLQGSVTVGDLNTRDLEPRDFAGIIGYCPQDAAAAFVTDTVETELAWSMEQLGVHSGVMARRVDSTAALLGLHTMLTRRVGTLSMGERQRLAVGAALTAQPRVLVLDEPTSMLDPIAAEELLASLHRIVSDLGVTVIMAEHRLERVMQFCDAVVAITADGAASYETPERGIAAAGLRTPMMDLSQRLGWPHVPASIRDARRMAADTRRELAQRALNHAVPAAAPATPPATAPITAPLVAAPLVTAAGAAAASTPGTSRGEAPTDPPPQTPVLLATDIWVQRGNRFAVRGAHVSLRTGEVVALTGRNGSGKSTLLSALAGAERPSRGSVRVDGRDPDELSGRQLIRTVAWLPPTPLDLMSASSVRTELASNDSDGGLDPGTTQSVLKSFDTDIALDTHPRDLSAGQCLSVALAILLAHRPLALLLDEPTVGLDYGAKARLTTWLGTITATGSAVIMATHDTEVIAACVDRVITLADGELIGDDPARDALLASVWSAPQLARVFHPVPIIRLDELDGAAAADKNGDVTP